MESADSEEEGKAKPSPPQKNIVPLPLFSGERREKGQQKEGETQDGAPFTIPGPTVKGIP